MTREQALELVKKHTKNQNLVRHMLAVEAAMRSIYRYLYEDESSYAKATEDRWGLAGLLHDADYEETKETAQKNHTKLLLKWLEDYEVGDELKSAIAAHAWNYVEGAPKPQNKFEWALYTCDELTGLIVAVALVKGGKISEVSVESVMKKWKQKSFAAGANRDQIAMCEEKLKIKLEDFVAIVLQAMQSIKSDLGLK